MTACNDSSHPWLTTDELARCAARLDDIERRDDLHKSGAATSAERLSLIALTCGPERILSAVVADQHRAAAGLTPRDPARQAVATALSRLPFYVSGAKAWQPFVGIDGSAMLIGVELPQRRYPGDERYAEADAVWALTTLGNALAWLATQVPLTVLSSKLECTARGASATVRFDRVIDVQVAA